MWGVLEMAAKSWSSAWVRFYCSTDKQARMARFRRIDGTWQLVSVGDGWSSDDNPPGELTVEGSFGISPGYGGCPGCRNDSYARCGNCAEMGCWKSGTRKFTCAACRTSDKVAGSIQFLNAMEAG